MTGAFIKRNVLLDPTAAMLAAAVLVLHLVGNPHYGFFRDELYFIVCGRAPDWGYVDQPPLVPLLAAGSQLFGTSLFAIRAVPALLAALAAYTACRLADDLGGMLWAKVLAVLGTALAPVLAAFGTMLGPDTVETPLWTLAILCTGRALMRDPRYWLATGAAIGVAGQAKYSAVMMAAALVIGIALTSKRRALLNRWFWGGVLTAGVILLPNALWQAAHGLPMLELLRNGQNGKNVILSPTDFLLQQLLMTNPVLSLLWLAGLARCFFLAPWRWLSVTACALLAIMIALHGKAYYPTPIYPALFAAGGVVVERFAWPRLRPVIALLAFASGAILLPIVLPILPEPSMLAYLDFLAEHGVKVRPAEHHKEAELGQNYADMHGWQALADTLTDIYKSLPPAQQAKARIFTGNYGEAAAIDVLAAGHGLPPTLSGHNQYWLWGPRGWDGSVLLDVGGDLADDQALCREAKIVGEFKAPYVMPYEDDMSIILCLDMKEPVSEIWPKQKHFD